MNDDTLGMIVGLVVFVLFIGGLGWYAFVFAPSANKAIDAYADRKHQQWLEDKARCEELGGIATQSAWDGRITSCQKP